jgi:hypothetical protein
MSAMKNTNATARIPVSLQSAFIGFTSSFRGKKKGKDT